MKITKASLLLAPLLFFASSAFSAELIHNPVLTASVGQDVDVSAVVSGVNTGSRTRLYYRVKGKELYKSVEMTNAGSQVSGQIPGSDVVIPGVEYYIETTINGQVAASNPMGNYKLLPNFITVRKDETAPNMNILSPMDGDEVDTAQPVITVSYGDADSGVDTSSVLVKIDGVVVKDKNQIQAFDTLMSYVPSDELSQGKHEIAVVAKDKAGNVASLKWNITVKSKFGSKQAALDPNQYHWSGFFSYETMYGYVSPQPANPSTYLPFRPYGVNRGRLQVDGRGPDDTYQLKVYKTDEERSDQQPTDRYTALMKSDEGIIALGDYSPSFSELSLYNPFFFRGVTVDLRSGPSLAEGHTRFMGVFGQTQRAVEAGVNAYSSIPGSPQFEEYLYGTRWELGGKYYGFGLNAVTVNDDAGSINNTTSLVPKYTAVGSADLQLKVPQIFLVMSGESAADYYLNGPGITGVTAGNSYKAAADVNVVPWASHASFEWRDLGGGFPIVPGGFSTLANPGLLPDYRGFESSLSQGILNGQLSLSGNFNRWHDNLNGAKDLSSGTTQTDFWSVFGNAAFTGLPYLNVGVVQNIQKNDTNGNTLLVQTNFVSTSFSLSLGYNYIINPSSSLTSNFAFSNTTFRDLAAAKVAQDLDSNNYTLSLFYVRGDSSFSAAGSMGTNNQPGLGGGVSYGGLTTPAMSGNSQTISVAWIQRWMPKIFDTHLNYDFAKNHSESPEVDSTTPVTLATNIDSTRSTYALGFDYTLKVVHTFGLVFSYADVNSSSNQLGVALNDHVGELLGDFTYNYTF